jgi:hypothetical protein
MLEDVEIMEDDRAMGRKFFARPECTCEIGSVKTYLQARGGSRGGDGV